MKTPQNQTKLLIEELIKLEKCGKYEDALAELQDIWEDKTTLPNVDEFEPRVAAEILLRCGSLFGFLGHNEQIPNAQEKSKNLLTEARQRFLEIYDVEKIAECENYIALAYWRTGELREAEVWTEESLSRNLSETSEIRVYCLLIKNMVLFSNEDFENVQLGLKRVESLFNKYGDNFLNGSYYTNLGLTLKNLGNTSDALKELELARSYHQKSGHQIYLGTVENNLAQLYKEEGKFLEAHLSVDNATEIFSQINDRTRKGFSLDTKAQIYFAEDKFDEALETADNAIEILKRSENSAYLVETYLTKIKILIAMDDISSALLCFGDAIQIARTQISEESANNLANEFETEIRKKILPVISNIFSEKEIKNEDLQLVLPPSISRYHRYQVVRIKHNHLAKVGLKPEMLAIVVDAEVKKGDLVAITEIKDGSVRCGFYDADFGMVCLEGIDSEPQLLNENEIKILGKIVGVCDPKIKVDGKLEVKPI